MIKQIFKNPKNLLPYIGLSILTGVFSAILVTGFKLAAEFIIHSSVSLYNFVRSNHIYIPIMIVIAATIGYISSCILKICHSCRGGGIPTSIAALRGIITFKWFISIIVLPISALLTFFCGIPLGTEGPCVQMGTAIGDGVAKCFGGKRNQGWRRYLMTGGATAGFSIATVSPITSIIFSIEELHKRFSPILVIGSSISVASAQITVKFLSLFGINTNRLFDIPNLPSISGKSLFIPLITGIICGVASLIFTLLYHYIDEFIHFINKKIPIKLIFPILFSIVALTGFFISDATGTGHSLVEKLLHTQSLWYTLILLFVIRTVCTMIANTSGVTGGLFLPTLAFGAILGSLCATVIINLNLVNSESYMLIVILGISAFLGATSRIPITACVFAIEALGGINNVLPIIVSTVVAYLIVEFSGLEDFTDSVINAKIRSINKDKEPESKILSLTVKPDSFAIGKKISEILWPVSCSVISFERSRKSADNSLIEVGDVITICYQTNDSTAINDELTILVGEQS
ncbi:MAG: hypothetical protein E7565_09680 [Ruminococcaceae bacterium]|nr:hypothetical protein [Oscillospiraceae bacterium]